MNPFCVPMTRNFSWARMQLTLSRVSISATSRPMRLYLSSGSTSSSSSISGSGSAIPAGAPPPPARSSPAALPLHPIGKSLGGWYAWRKKLVKASPPSVQLELVLLHTRV